MVEIFDANGIKLEKVSDVIWELPIGTIKGMRVPGRVFASKLLLDKIKSDRTIQQLANVATLPGIHKQAMVMPDAHQGYGFPIGGVAALDYEDGGISPGGIGYDINCGVRLIRTNLTEKEVRPVLPKLVETLFNTVPSGVGSSAKMKLDDKQLNDVLTIGAQWAINQGYGWPEDLKHLEEEGSLDAADPQYISETAIKRGKPQLGTLGAGNHFLEIQKVDRVFNKEAAAAFGINNPDQVVVMLHTGSRGFGHQVASDYIRILEKEFKEELSKLPDRELVFAPAGTKRCEEYLKSMSCAANFAWANRQMLTHGVRDSFEKVFNTPAEKMDMHIVYDVAHNLAKVEKHNIDGKIKKVYIHRKGATRAFGPGRPEIPKDYQKVGQPVLIPGSMGTASYVLVGSQTSMDVTFGSTCHGAGRVMSRSAANKIYNVDKVKSELKSQGILVRSANWKGVTEEAPGAYKDIDEVARVSDAAGVGKLVVRLRPMGVVKG